MIKKTAIPFYFMVIIVLMALFFPSLPKNDGNYEYNGADVAWMLTSTALVLIMTPGLAYFYGGMVRKKNVISTMLLQV